MESSALHRSSLSTRVHRRSLRGTLGWVSAGLVGPSLFTLNLGWRNTVSGSAPAPLATPFWRRGPVILKKTMTNDYSEALHANSAVRLGVAGTSQPHFQPWEGSGYSDSAHRLLLVGEGHYLPESESRYDTPTLTKEIVGRVRDGTQVLPFYTRTAPTVLGALGAKSLGSNERITFWNRVAFYNYIPGIVASQARQRPTSEMWAAAPAPFCAVLTKLRPHCVLVLGKSLWNAIRFVDGWSSATCENADAAVRLWHSPADDDMFATWIAHPSSFGYSRMKWSLRAAALFAAQESIADRPPLPESVSQRPSTPSTLDACSQIPRTR